MFPTPCHSPSQPATDELRPRWLPQPRNGTEGHTPGREVPCGRQRHARPACAGNLGLARGVLLRRGTERAGRTQPLDLVGRAWPSAGPLSELRVPDITTHRGTQVFCPWSRARASDGQTGAAARRQRRLTVRVTREGGAACSRSWASLQMKLVWGSTFEGPCEGVAASDAHLLRQDGTWMQPRL